MRNFIINVNGKTFEVGVEEVGATASVAPVAPVVSAPVAGIYFVGDAVADVFKKGENISINQGDIIQVELVKPIDMPVY